MWGIDSGPSDRDAGLVSLSGLGRPKAMMREDKEVSWKVSQREQKTSCYETMLFFFSIKLLAACLKKRSREIKAISVATHLFSHSEWDRNVLK